MRPARALGLAMLVGAGTVSGAINNVAAADFYQGKTVNFIIGY